jgi:uncharacterized membrane protein (DUF485 family)
LGLPGAAARPSEPAGGKWKTSALNKGTDMDTKLAERIAALPAYKELKERRSRLGWWLTIAMLVVYYGFILLIAFDKELLATRIGDGVMTLGIPLGFGVIVFTVIITAYYVMRANSEFDELSEKVRREALK